METFNTGSEEFKFVWLTLDGTAASYGLTWVLRLCGFFLSFFPLPKKTEESLLPLSVSEHGPAVSDDLSGGGGKWKNKQRVHAINGTAWHHIINLNLNLVLILQMCVSGSSDIQEDHSQEQRQEKEDVWVIHWDVTTAYVLGGWWGGFLSDV